MPETASKPATSPSSSPASDAVRYVWHHATQVAEYADVGPAMLVRGQGVSVWDAAGREYLDATSILGVTQIGHGRREVADAVAKQMMTLEYASLANGFSHPAAATLARRLATITPGSVELAYFCCSGSEAVDTALKIARQYHRLCGATGRFKILSRRGSYHGVTMGATSATGLTPFRAPFEPLLPGFIQIAQPYVYRSETELGCAPEQTGEFAARALEQQILAEGPDSVAAFIAEPVALPQAIKVPPADYWPRVQAICRKYGVLLIVDEVFNGFGRTGRMFGSEHFGIEPDILVVSKGLTSGYVPLSAAIVTPEVGQAFWGEPQNAFAHGGTYSGHPVACAAALANLDIIERESLVERSATNGQYLKQRLETLRDRPFVGNVSGIGQLLSVELVTDKKTKSVAPPRIGNLLKNSMQRDGVLARYLGHSIYFYPPLIATHEHSDRIMAAFTAALELAQREVGA